MKKKFEVSDYYIEYNNYLKGTSIFGRLYRRYYLYPVLRLIVGNKFIDIGCGLGDFLSFGSKKSLGLDVNPLNVESCLERGLNADLIENDTFPVGKNSWDFAIVDQVLEHIENPDRFLLEVKRIIKPTGKLLIGVPCYSGYNRDPDHKIFYGKKKIISTLANYGFKTIFHFYMPLPFAFLGRFLKQQSLYIVAINTG